VTDTFVSPAEIKKFIHCPYAWYYEKKFGRKALAEMHRERNEKLGYVDTGKSLYEKGRRFHERYRPFSLRRELIRIAVIIIFIACAYFYIRFINI